MMKGPGQITQREGGPGALIARGDNGAVFSSCQRWTAQGVMTQGAHPASADCAGGVMPPEVEAKLIAPGELRLPDLSGLVKAATAVRLPGRHLEAIYYDTAEL